MDWFVLPIFPFHNHSERPNFTLVCVDNYFKMEAWLFHGNKKYLELDWFVLPIFRVSQSQDAPGWKPREAKFHTSVSTTISRWRLGCHYVAKRNLSKSTILQRNCKKLTAHFDNWMQNHVQVGLGCRPIGNLSQLMQRTKTTFAFKPNGDVFAYIIYMSFIFIML